MEVFADFRGDLAVGHLIDGFHGDDVSTELVSLQTLLELAFGFTGAEDQNGIGMTDGCNHLIVVLAQMARKLPLVAIIGLNLL